MSRGVPAYEGQAIGGQKTTGGKDFPYEETVLAAPCAGIER